MDKRNIIQVISVFCVSVPVSISLGLGPVGSGFLAFGINTLVSLLRGKF